MDDRAAPGLVLLVGAPRSGTTWLQSLLAAHPAVASPQETDLFSRYVSALDEGWRWQTRGGPEAWAERRHKGLPAVLTETEFLATGRALVRQTLDAVLRLKPGATVVVEKSPSHSLCVDVVRRYAPEARFLHLVRDGRDVAASIVAAASGWGRSWAPRSLGDAAATWAEYVRGARQAAGDGDGYLELRYEDLLTGGAPVLEAAFRFCGVDAGAAACARLLEEYSFEAMARRGSLASSILVGGELGDGLVEPPEPEGFFRQARVGGWREDWTPADRARFDAAAGDLLVELGYERDRSWAGVVRTSVIARVAVVLARGARRAGRAVAARADRYLERSP